MGLLAVVSVAVVAAAATCLFSEKRRGRTGYLKLWLAGLASMVLAAATLALSIWLGYPSWSIVYLNATVVGAFIAIWAGCRQFNNRSIHSRWLCAAVIIAALMGLFAATPGTVWVSINSRLVAVVALCVLVVVETRAARMRRLQASWILITAMVAFPAYVLSLQSASLHLAHGGSLPNALRAVVSLASAPAILGAIALLTALALAAVHLEDRWRIEIPVRSAHLAVSPAVLEAAPRDAAHLVTIRVSIVNIGQLRTTYSGRHVDDLLSDLTDVILDHLSGILAISRDQNDRISVYLPTIAPEELAALTDRLQVACDACSLDSLPRRTDRLLIALT